MSRRPALAVLLLLLVAAPLRAQVPALRYELGRHLRDFEDALDAQTDEKARRRGLTTLRPVTAAFFSLQFDKAARILDQSRLALAADGHPVEVAWAQSISVAPAARLIDRGAGGVAVKGSAFYKQAGRPEKFQVRLTLTTPDGKPVAGPVVLHAADVPFAGQFPFKDVPQGDYLLRAEILSGDKTLAVGQQMLSLADRLNDRLDKLNAVVKGFDDRPATTDRESVRRLAKLLNGLRNGETQETDYPAARLLAETEAAAAAVAADKPFYGQKRPGDFHLMLVNEKGVTPARLMAPEAATRGVPLPLVIVLHGLGGSENMFFDGHGRGLVARLGRERGWLVVAPRDGFPPDLIDVVDRLYPVDRKRVFVIGHSLGAMRTVQAASEHPERYAAVACLAGGAAPRPSDGLQKLPFFVAVGTEDNLMLRAVRELEADLKKAEVRKIVYKEYAGVEHLTVVQLGLPDVYAFFDEVVK